MGTVLFELECSLVVRSNFFSWFQKSEFLKIHTQGKCWAFILQGIQFNLGLEVIYFLDTIESGLDIVFLLNQSVQWNNFGQRLHDNEKNVVTETPAVESQFQKLPNKGLLEINRGEVKGVLEVG